MENKEKLSLLFNYIKEFCQLKTRIVKDVSKQTWCMFLDDLPADNEFVKLSYFDDDEATSLLEVEKPDFSRCPEPDDEIKVIIDSNWENFKKEVVLKESLNGKNKDEFFEDKEFLHKYQEWYKARELWVEEQRRRESIRNLFLELFRLKAFLDRDSETYELMVGEGIITDTEDSDISHPILLKKISMDFDAQENKISLYDSDSVSELYGMLLNGMSNLNYAALAELKDELYINDYHPLDRFESRNFLKTATHKLCAESKFVDEGEERRSSNSDRITVTIKPVFFLRKKLDGTAKLVEKILESISNATDDTELPKHLIDIVGGGKNDIVDSEEEMSIPQKLAAIGGEDENILLAKEANSEQLEIAKRISKYNAVLVQGPPGTGKTHTIANLLGNFLAEGKTVLVTSQTRKALSVLKEKIPENIRSLCVSLLDDRNEDMERSIDGITEKMSSYSSFDLRKKADKAKLNRLEIINALAETREQIYNIKFQEFNPIIYNGERISPIEAAKFVNENSEELAIIPGKVEAYKPLPVSFEDLSKLYRTNISVSASDEKQLELDLPHPEELLMPNEFCDATEEIHDYEEKMCSLAKELDMHVDFDYEDGEFELTGNGKKIEIDLASAVSLEGLKKYAKKFENIPKWKIKALVDGMKGGSHTVVWRSLIESIKAAYDCEQRTYFMLFDKDISITSPDVKRISAGISVLRKEYHDKGKISPLKRLTDKNIKFAEENVLVNGKAPESELECVATLFYIELQEKRNNCARFWDNLISEDGSVLKFYSLDEKNPESIAQKFIPEIESALTWYEEESDVLKILLKNAGIDYKEFFQINKTDSEENTIRKIITILSERAPKIVNICELFRNAYDGNKKLHNIYGKLRYEKSDICKEIYKAYAEQDAGKYRKEHFKLSEMYSRYTDFYFRKKTLEKIYDVAPGWASAIENREGEHGKEKVPSNIEDAWKWKQFSAIISDMSKVHFDELQDKSATLSKKYREATAELVEWESWYNLSKRTEGDISMRQALNGWKQTIKKIGKGKGRYAAELKAQARQLMKQCQDAVPVWIMPLGKAIENFEPGKNLFDIMIVDEASQSDISSLAALYLAKKIIIVGDDKQVSPMSVGLDLDKMGAIVSSTIKDKIPNSHLYDGTSSLYDIAGTVYPALMLKEHFRCVPDIIGYSNKLSYDGMIKPLRDANGVKILPAVVNYHVDGHRELSRKVNVTEARAIVAAIESCMEREEYKGKTFGVITLLGEEQARYIENLIFEKIDISEIEERKILCGNSAQFQGDERDIIFLSMVDSNEDDGPLPMKSDPGDSEKKRYNVAASRARDQLWVVNSLDASKDLKVGDLRRGLLEYASNPTSFAHEVEQVTARSESVFEENVAKALISKGYKIIPQWEVGAYRIDMVAVSGNKKVAIECDGEMWHSGEEKVREDMERQTILERIGWKFIRIRGSEYFRNPKKVMERVVKGLKEYGIEPTDSFTGEIQPSTELLDGIKIRISEIVSEWDKEKPFVHDPSSIEFALKTKRSKFEKKETEKNKKTEKEVKVTTSEQLGQISLFDTEKKVVKTKKEDIEKKVTRTKATIKNLPTNETKKGIILSNSRSYIFTIPESFVFGQTKIDVDSWRSLYFEFVKILIDKYPQVMENLIGKSIMGKGNIDIQTEQRRRFMSFPKRVSEELYVETNLDIDAIIQRILSLLKICKKPLDSLVVCLSEPKSFDKKLDHLKNWADEELKGDGTKILLENLALASDLAVERKITNQTLILEDDLQKVTVVYNKLLNDDVFIKLDVRRINKMKKALDNYKKYLQKK